MRASEDESALLARLLDRHHGSEAFCAAVVLGQRGHESRVRVAYVISQEIDFGGNHAVYRLGKGPEGRVLSVNFVGMEREFCRLYLAWALAEAAPGLDHSPACFAEVGRAAGRLVAVGSPEEALAAMRTLRSVDLPKDAETGKFVDYGIRRWLTTRGVDRELKREALLLAERLPDLSAALVDAVTRIAAGKDEELRLLAARVLAKG